MSVRYLGFVVLLCSARVLHTQRTAESCHTPKLDHGHFVPVQDTYPHEYQLFYSCDEGHKPVVEGWWATSICQNGTWDHCPQCIDKNACLPPTIPKAKYTASSRGWYMNQYVIQTTCDDEYEHKDGHTMGRCTNGTWNFLPVCEKRNNTCNEPPKVPHAVITAKEYQEVFPVDTEVQYECENGYTREGGQTKTSVFCITGTWTEPPMCTKRTSPGTGHGGSAAGGASGGFPTQPMGTVTICGDYPKVRDGDVVSRGDMFLKYKCKDYYTLVGSAIVRCHSNGTWTQTPSCRASYCTLDNGVFITNGEKYMRHGEVKELECVNNGKWYFDHYARIQCTDQRITSTPCCWWIKLKTKKC